jgi:hypothetical protein
MCKDDFHNLPYEAKTRAMTINAEQALVVNGARLVSYPTMKEQGRRKSSPNIAKKYSYPSNMRYTIQTKKAPSQPFRQARPELAFLSRKIRRLNWCK